MSEQSIETVLLVEDNLGDARLLREMFNEHAAQNSELTLVASMSGAEKHLSEHSVDLILLDLGLPDAQGLEAIRRARAAAPRAALVVLTGRDDESLAAQALQEGAQDYLVKGQIDTRRLLRALRYQAPGSVERRIHSDSEPRAAYAVDIHFRLARSSHGQNGRQPARSGSPSAYDRAHE
jgi:DNA-binding response OmpR family regulator